MSWPGQGKWKMGKLLSFNRAEVAKTHRSVIVIAVSVNLLFSRYVKPLMLSLEDHTEINSAVPSHLLTFSLPVLYSPLSYFPSGPRREAALPSPREGRGGPGRCAPAVYQARRRRFFTQLQHDFEPPGKHICATFLKECRFLSNQYAPSDKAHLGGCFFFVQATSFNERNAFLVAFQVL